jgi:coenzyme F420-reducing hydrogenase delta subunit
VKKEAPKAAPVKKEVPKVTPVKKEAPKKEGDSDEKKKKVPENPEDLKKQFLEHWPSLHEGAASHHQFLRIFRPKNALQIGGMTQQFRNDPTILYSLELLVAGNQEAVDEFLAEDVIQKWMDEVGISEDQVRSNLINAKNFEKRRNDNDFKELVDAKKETRKALFSKIEQIKGLIEKSKTAPRSKKETLLEKLEEYRTTNRAYDVSAWDENTHSGYKTVSAPTGRSQKKRLTSYQICANSAEKIAKFIKFLGIDEKVLEEIKN